MDATLHPTPEFFTFNFNGVNVPTRIWQGVTPNGTPITAYVVAVVPTSGEDEDAAKMEAELPDFMVRTHTYLTLREDGVGFLITRDPATQASK